MNGGIAVFVLSGFAPDARACRQTEAEGRKVGAIKRVPAAIQLILPCGSARLRLGTR